MGRVVQTHPGTVPRRKHYLEDGKVPRPNPLGSILSLVLPLMKGLDTTTQKPEALLERILQLRHPRRRPVLDCFVGSGTTAVVAEKLNRRWIACDFSRFAIHTTRKSLFGLSNVRPFVVQNLGKYERQAWQVAEFPANGKDHLEEQRQREAAYRRIHSRPLPCEAIFGPRMAPRY